MKLRGREKKPEAYEQLSLFKEETFSPAKEPSWYGQVIGQLQALELANMTPLAALNKLYELQSQIKKMDSQKS